MIKINIGKLAESIGVHRNTVRNWIKAEQLKARVTIGKKYQMDRHELCSFLVAKGVPEETINSLISKTGTPKKKSSAPTKLNPSTVAPQKPEISAEVVVSGKPIGSVLVVGGGIAGIQTSLDLADLGYYVYLVEQKPGIGMGMARLDKTFPTNDCAM